MKTSDVTIGEMVMIIIAAILLIVPMFISGCSPPQEKPIPPSEQPALRQVNTPPQMIQQCIDQASEIQYCRDLCKDKPLLQWCKKK